MPIWFISLFRNWISEYKGFLDDTIRNNSVKMAQEFLK
jgi:hypothetical protein